MFFFHVYTFTAGAALVFLNGYGIEWGLGRTRIYEINHYLLPYRLQYARLVRSKYTRHLCRVHRTCIVFNHRRGGLENHKKRDSKIPLLPKTKRKTELKIKQSRCFPFDLRARLGTLFVVRRRCRWYDTVYKKNWKILHLSLRLSGTLQVYIRVLQSTRKGRSYESRSVQRARGDWFLNAVALHVCESVSPFCMDDAATAGATYADINETEVHWP